MPDRLELPPYAQMMGIHIDAERSERAVPVLAMPFGNQHAGAPGILHGGAIAGLLDMAASAALQASLIAAGQSPIFKPIGITIDYMRAGKHQTTWARGRVTRVGSRVATVVVEAWQDEDRRTIAAARLHMLLAGSPG